MSTSPYMCHWRLEPFLNTFYVAIYWAIGFFVEAFPCQFKWNNMKMWQMDFGSGGASVCGRGASAKCHTYTLHLSSFGTRRSSQEVGLTAPSWAAQPN